MNNEQKTFIERNTYKCKLHKQNEEHNRVPLNLSEDDDIITNYLNAKTSREISLKAHNILKQQLHNTKESRHHKLMLANIAIYLRDFIHADKLIKDFKKEHGIITNITGRNANVKWFDGIENSFLVLDIQFLQGINIDDQKYADKFKKVLFETEKLKYKDFYVDALSINVQTLILTELELIMQSEYSSDYLNEKIQAYIDRLEYIANEKNDLITRLIHFYNSFIDNDISEALKRVINKSKPIDYDLYLKLPIKFVCAFQLRLAHIYFKTFFYEHAMEIYEEYGDIENIIKCYVGMGKEKEAIKNLKKLEISLKEEINQKFLEIRNLKSLNEKKDQQKTEIIEKETIKQNLQNVTNEEKENEFTQSQRNNNNLINNFNNNLNNNFDINKENKKDFCPIINEEITESKKTEPQNIITETMKDFENLKITNIKKYKSKTKITFVNHVETIHDKINKLNGNIGLLKIRLSNCYILLGALTEDVSYYDLSFETSPHSEPLKQKGFYYFNDNNFELAHKYFSEALKINRTGSILFHCGASLLKLENYEDALICFEEYSLYETRDMCCLSNIIACCYQLEKHELGYKKLKENIMRIQNEDLKDIYSYYCHMFGEKNLLYK
ncbi:hypothetical protein COBT_000673 [Conglomerata obtusa]